MDEVDETLIAALRRDGRRSVSDLAQELGISRATVRARMERLIASGEIAGFTVQLRTDLQEPAIRAITLIEVEGKSSDQVVQRLSGIPEVLAIHSTNGRWDLIAEIGTPDLEAFDRTLSRIRLIEGISATETSLLLSTRKRVGALAPRR
ncbi:MAG TPA: Lrp/AsnC family transcriptional regulator [Hyphomicrobiales bacterium]